MVHRYIVTRLRKGLPFEVPTVVGSTDAFDQAMTLYRDATKRHPLSIITVYQPVLLGTEGRKPK